MKKQVILGLFALSVASCGGVNRQNQSYETLADMFVWGDTAEETIHTTDVFYKNTETAQVKEVNNSDYKNYQYNDDVEVKYVELKQPDEIVDETGVVIEKEIVIDEQAPDQDPQTYTLTKRSDRYKNVDETFSADVYAILASRVANKFLTDIPGILAEIADPTFFIADTENVDRYMPAGADAVGNTTKYILQGSRMFEIVTDEETASHVLKGRLTNINTPEIPVFQYSLSLYDKDGNLVDKWTDTIRQVQNDDGSWW